MTEKHIAGMMAEVQGFIDVSISIKESFIDKNKVGIGIVAPWIVNAAFAAELSMKAIRENDGRVWKNTHHLRELFEDCPDEFCNNVKFAYSKANNVLLTFDDALARSDNLFIDFRYLFEEVRELYDDQYFLLHSIVIEAQKNLPIVTTYTIRGLHKGSQGQA